MTSGEDVQVTSRAFQPSFRGERLRPITQIEQDPDRLTSLRRAADQFQDRAGLRVGD